MSEAERGEQRLSDFDKGYDAAITAAVAVLRDMPGIVDNDVNPPREMPDYIEKAEAVKAVGKLRPARALDEEPFPWNVEKGGSR